MKRGRVSCNEYSMANVVNELYDSMSAADHVIDLKKVKFVVSHSFQIENDWHKTSQGRNMYVKCMLEAAEVLKPHITTDSLKIWAYEYDDASRKICRMTFHVYEELP